MQFLKKWQLYQPKQSVFLLNKLQLSIILIKAQTSIQFKLMRQISALIVFFQKMLQYIFLIARPFALPPAKTLAFARVNFLFCWVLSPAFARIVFGETDFVTEIREVAKTIWQIVCRHGRSLLPIFLKIVKNFGYKYGR